MEIERKWEISGFPEGLEPVSYTHLDVYKRQGQIEFRVFGHRRGAKAVKQPLCKAPAHRAQRRACLLYTSRCV